MLDLINIPFLTLLYLLYLGYAVVVALFLILENRSPQLTFAWLFLLLVVPVLGLVFYLFFGQGWHVFSHERDLMRQAIGDEVQNKFATFLARQDEILANVEQKERSSAKRRLLHLVQSSGNSVLTTRNCVEILQNASQKYPRLLADIEAAHHSIHMAYYIWDEDAFTLELQALLIRKAKEGVEVRILVDDFGFNVSRRYQNKLRKNGVQIFVYYNYRSPCGCIPSVIVTTARLP